MDYEKKYKEVLSKAKQVYKKPYIAHWDVMKGLIEHFFPEIEESEDERIKKDLLIFLDDVWHLGREANFDKWGKADCSDWMAWLEKAVTPTPQDWNDYKDKPVEVWNAYVKGLANGIERGKEAVKNHPQDYGLEKQGEKENFIEKELGCIRGYREEALRRLQELEKQKEPEDKGEISDGTQAHVDKVEQKYVPKFHEGDWVACNSDNLRSPLRIVSISDTDYKVENTRGVPGRPMIEYLDRHYHLWTIQDAKCGDVLAGEYDDCKKHWVGIFKCISENRPQTQFDSYCFITCYRHEFITPDSCDFCNRCKGHTIRYTKPATKKQRDILFQKMNEAGYEWDAEKKELKELSHL